VKNSSHTAHNGWSHQTNNKQIAMATTDE